MTTTTSPAERLLEVLLDGDLEQTRSIVAEGVMPGTMGMTVTEVRDGLRELAAAGMLKTRPNPAGGAVWSVA